MVTESDIIGKSKGLMAAVDKRGRLKAKYDETHDLYQRLKSAQKKIASAKLVFDESGWVDWPKIPHICYTEVQGDFLKFNISDLNHIDYRKGRNASSKDKEELKARERTFERQMKAQHAMIEAFLPYPADEEEDYRLGWQAAVMEVGHMLSDMVSGGF